MLFIQCGRNLLKQRFDLVRFDRDEERRGAFATSGLKPVVHAGGVGGSDHVSFYRKGISCIGFHTGGHPQYHTPEDDAPLINVKGIEKVARYIYRAVVGLSNYQQPFRFVKQD